MNYYPIHLDLRGKKVLVVGAGVIAARKVQELLKCGAKITLIAPSLHPDLKKMKDHFKWIKKEYCDEKVSPYFLVIAATNDRLVNDRIWKACEEDAILVNVVDDRKRCNFIATGVARCGDMLISISTGGAAPFLTRYLAQEFRKNYGKSFKKYLDLLKQARIDVKRRVSDPKIRDQIFAKLCASEIMERARRGEDKWVSSAVKTILKTRAPLKIAFVTRLSEKMSGKNKTQKIPEPYLQ
jgi:precorrin-2 dehydrogenase/sirohydrochlorin ferrochelatase